MPGYDTHADNRQFAVQVVRQLRDAGFEALWAGGCVRDQLLGITPSDYDVATNAHPDQVRECFGYRRTLAIGAAFGVITVRGRRGQGQIEVATFRSDATYSDGRHPDSVTFSSAQEDAQRRDFTMNGLFFDPLSDQVIDYVGGAADLRAGIVRAIGDPYQRIGEDKLRMLRGVRFAATYSFQLDATTRAAIVREAAQVVLVSVERIAAEMRKMMVHSHRARATTILREVGLLQVILPEAEVLWDSSAGPPATGDRGDGNCTEENVADWDRTLAVLNSLQNPTFRVALAALLWGVRVRHHDEDCIAQICRRWKLSNYEQSGVEWLLANQETIRQAQHVPWSRLQPLLVTADIQELLALAEAISVQLEQGRVGCNFCRKQLQRPPAELNPEVLITGDDLLRAGFTPGPAFRDALQQVRDAQLEQQVHTRQQAMELAARVLVDAK